MKETLVSILTKNASIKDSIVVVQHDSQSTSNMLFYHTKNLVEELIEETRFRGQILFLVHIPSERASQFSYSFEEGWSIYYVESLVSYSRFTTTKYFLTTPYEQIIHDIFSEDEKFMKAFFEQKLGTILSTISPSPFYQNKEEGGIGRMIRDYSTILDFVEVRDYLYNYFIEMSKGQDLLAANGKKADTEQPLHKSLNENLTSNLSKWTAHVINHLDTNDNFTIRLRTTLPKGEVDRLFFFLLGKFSKPSATLAHNGSSFTCHFPFSFFLIEIFRLNLDNPHFNSWKDKPVCDILAELDIHSHRDFFEAYIKYVFFLSCMSHDAPNLFYARQ